MTGSNASSSSSQSAGRRSSAANVPGAPVPPPPPGSRTESLPASREAINKLRDRIGTLLEQADYGKAESFAIQLAYEEAMSNALNHGSRGIPDASIEVAYFVDSDHFYLRVRDEGPGFDPETMPDPTLEQNLTNLSGRGLLLMRAYMTEVHFNDRGNEVTLIRRNDG